MPWQFILAIVFAIFAVLFWIGWKLAKQDDSKAAAALATGICAGIALMLLVLSSLTVVGTRNIGIQTSFNRPTGTLSNGIHTKAPWTKVVEWDGKLQNLGFTDNDDKDFSSGVPVRLGNQSVATVDLILQYKLTTDDGVLELFKNYGSEESLKRNLVSKSLQAAMNESFKTFDPIVVLAQTGDRSPTTGMPELAKTTEDALRSRMPAGIEIVSLTIVMPHYDAQTEERIKAFNTAIQDTAIAKQRQETAVAIKAANDILAASNASPEVLYQNCLDMVERVVKGGGALPAGFSCSSGGSVVIPAK